MRKIFDIYVKMVLPVMFLVFLPVVVDAWGFGKNLVWVFLGIIGLLIWLATMILEKKWVVKVNRMWWVAVAAMGWALLGWGWLKTGIGVKMAALMTPAGMGTLIGVVVWMFLWMQVDRKDGTKKEMNYLTVAGVLVALGSLVVFLIPLSKLPFSWPKVNPIISIDSGFSMAGSLWGEIIILVWLAFEWMRRLVVKLKKDDRDVNGYIKEAGVVVFLTLILVLDVFRMTKLWTGVLDLNSAWSIATETLKRSPVFGAGMGNYANAFNLLRPASFNVQENWAAIFGTATMGWLQWWTELGVGGLVLIALGLGGWLAMKKKESSFWEVGLIMIMVGLMPISLAGIGILAWLLAVKIETKEIRLKLGFGEGDYNVMPVIVGLLTVVGTGFAGYWTARMMIGEIKMKQALIAVTKNEAGTTYNLQIQAIQQNPYVASYRRIASQTNLALAQSLLVNKDINDEDKQKAATLIQQAVGEAKAAIALDGNNYLYWGNLAAIYKSIIGVVDGAADWSYQAYVQTSLLDPVNPVVKLDLGGLLYAANRIEEADRVFEAAVQQKSNYANAWYNWAYTAKRMNRLGDAVSRMSQAVALVPVNSGDYDKASKELDAWKKELEEAIKKQQMLSQQQEGQKVAETLKTAEPLPTVGPEEKVEVSKEKLEPPEVVVTAAPSPTEGAGEVNEE
jgi:tetratricopeptide (TPR) repeat protein